MNSRAPQISIVIPVYNEEENLSVLISELSSYSRNMEVIFVDDGSTDQSTEIIKNSGFQLISHEENCGYGAALKTGIKNASGEFVLIMDSDGQHQIKEIEKLITKCSDHDMVVGKRTTGGKMIRRPGKFLLRTAAWYLSGKNIPDLNSGFRIFRKDFAIRYFPILPDGFSFTTTITLAALVDGYRVSYVPVEVRPRSGGKSMVSVSDLFRTFYFILKIMVFFNPLKVFLPASILCLFTAAADLVFEWYTRGINIPDSFLLLFLSGLILFFFGLLADMISSMRKWRS